MWLQLCEKLELHPLPLGIEKPRDLCEIISEVNNTESAVFINHSRTSHSK